ncbi:hypothetical protein DFH29DRAFT_1002673 [Suillus ampliporus]|nr:hypothetical protein DFH29DRAFT_1002673 [Suillus ampliporus]
MMFAKLNYCLKSIAEPYRANVQEWKKAAELAAQGRGALLDIYQLKMDQAPTMAEIRLQLTENEMSTNGRSGSVAWLIEGINIENAQ